MKGLISLTLLASAASSVLAADLGIETTKEVQCTRKTKNGDSIQVHYRGTLQSNGNEFDASKLRRPASMAVRTTSDECEADLLLFAQATTAASPSTSSLEADR
jgi:hypothetical protein